MNEKFPKLIKGIFRKIEIKNGYSMIVADYKKNGFSVLITPFDHNFFHDEGEYLFIEPTTEALLKNPIKVSLFGEIYPVHCVQITEEILGDKKIMIYKSSFFLHSFKLKKNSHDTVILFRSYKDNNYCLIDIQSKNKRNGIFKLLKKRHPDYITDNSAEKKTISITTPKKTETHYSFYNEIINCLKIVLQ